MRGSLFWCLGTGPEVGRGHEKGPGTPAQWDAAAGVGQDGQAVQEEAGGDQEADRGGDILHSPSLASGGRARKRGLGLQAEGHLPRMPRATVPR